jgi:hypothetical protein
MKRIAVAALLLFSCNKTTESLPDGGLPPKDSGAEVDSGVETDSGVAPDSGVEPDAGVVAVRRLIDYSLFGTSPRDNLVVSPEFDLYTSGWFAVALDFMAYADQTKYHFPDTPTRQPAFRFSSPNGSLVIGTVRSASGPLSVSLWIGYDGSIDESVTAVASLIGTSTTGEQVAFDLAPDESTRVASGGRVWIRYWGMAGEAPVGFAQLYIQEDSDRRTYLTGPVVIPASTSQLGERRLSARKVLREPEQRALAEFARRMRENLGAAAPRSGR